MNEQIFYVNQDYDFFLGLLREEQPEKTVIAVKNMDKKWEIKELEPHLVFLLTLENLNILETKRRIVINEKAKKLDSELKKLNRELINYNNKLCSLRQMNLKNPNYEVNIIINNLEKTILTLEETIAQKTNIYMEVVQDINFQKRINKVKTKLF